MKIYHYRWECEKCYLLTVKSSTKEELLFEAIARRWCPNCQEYTNQRVELESVEEEPSV